MNYIIQNQILQSMDNKNLKYFVFRNYIKYISKQHYFVVMPFSHLSTVLQKKLIGKYFQLFSKSDI